MWCRDISQRLSAFLDGELPAWEYREVMRHLEVCSQCKMEYEKLQAVRKAVRELGKVFPRTVRSSGFSLEHVARTLRFRRMLWVFVVLLGFLTVLFLVIGWQRSSLDESIFNSNHFTAFSEDVLTRTPVRVDTVELVTGDYR